MELEFISWLQKQMPRAASVPLGIGDDAAVLELQSGRQCVLATDMLMDGVHFQLNDCGPALAGRKALAVNLSDLAAMAAEPRGALVSLALPKATPLTFAEQLIEGMGPLAEQFGCPLIGGDTNRWQGPLVINVCVVGEPAAGGCWTRSGGQAGDAILVSGQLGGSLQGRHLRFDPRVAEALALQAAFEVHAATDISDGLLRDLAHVTEASGCGAVVDLNAIPISPDAAASPRSDDHRSGLQAALYDGEDFELLIALPAGEAERLLAEKGSLLWTRIGQLQSKRGIWTNDSIPRPLEPGGYEH